VEKDGKTRQATCGNVIRCMRVTCWINKATDTRRLRNTYCFSTATMVMQTRLNVTFTRTLPVLSLNTSLSVYQFLHTLSNNSCYEAPTDFVQTVQYNSVTVRQVACERLYVYVRFAKPFV